MRETSWAWAARAPRQARTIGNPANWMVGSTSPVALRPRVTPGLPGHVRRTRTDSAARWGGSSDQLCTLAAGGQRGLLCGGRSMAAWYQSRTRRLHSPPYRTTADGLANPLQPSIGGAWPHRFLVGLGGVRSRPHQTVPHYPLDVAPTQRLYRERKSTGPEVQGFVFRRRRGNPAPGGDGRGARCRTRSIRGGNGMEPVGPRWV